MSDVRESHSWHQWRWNFNFATCKVCGLRCGRTSGGQGWPPGDWRYYDEYGNYTALRTCTPPKKSEP